MGSSNRKSSHHSIEEGQTLLQHNNSDNLSDEDEVQEESDTTCLPFDAIQSQCLAFNDSKLKRLLSGCEVKLKIKDCYFTKKHFRRRCIYVINLEHGCFKWTITKSYKDFLHLHNQILLYKAFLMIPIPTFRSKSVTLELKRKKNPKAPNLPFIPDIQTSKTDVGKNMHLLEEYLQKLLDIPVFKSYQETMEFLEVGTLSFVGDLGKKGREGFVLKKSGGHTAVSFFTSLRQLCTELCPRWSKRWLFTKDNFIGYINPKDGSIKCVMLIDPTFRVIRDGRAGNSKYLTIHNLSRNLYIECNDEREANDWEQELKSRKEKCTNFNKTNRFDSFAPPRNLTQCRWIVDGATYFEAVASVIDKAKEEILIADWWLTPEIYLKRPTIHGHHWQLDYLLKRKAREGVKIYVLLYQEVELALGINSAHSRQQLSRMHSNIKVLRHPNVSRGTILWAHHEKIVCVDQTYAFVGGLDLCYGRWDDYQHRLSDLGESAERLQVIRHMSSVMPQQSFRKSSFPVHRKSSLQEQIPSEAITAIKVKFKDSPHLERPVVTGEKRITQVQFKDPDISPGSRTKNWRFKVAVRKVQAIRTFQKIQKQLSFECLNIIKEAGPSGNQSLTPADIHRTIQQLALIHLKLERKFRLWHGKDYVNFIYRDFENLHEPYSDMINRKETPRMPWHDVAIFVQGSAARDIARHFIQRWNHAKREKHLNDPRYPYLLPKSYDDQNFNIPPVLTSEVGSLFWAECQVLRSCSTWSNGISITEHSIMDAYVNAIQDAKHFIYIENQFFITQPAGHRDVYNQIAETLYRRIIQAHEDGITFHVYVVLPLLPAFEGEVGTGSGTLIQAITHWNYHSMCRGNNSIFQRLSKKVKNPSQYISFYGLRTHGLLEGQLTCELVYVHSKMMIVDDCIAIIGSANINDRSLLGRRDSEIAVIVQDTQFVQEGNSRKAGKFCASLRKALFREHLGLMGKHKSYVDISDPINKTFFKDVWVKTAVQNTAIYEEVFRCIPTDKVHNFHELRQYQAVSCLAKTDPLCAIQKVKGIQGYLVLMPFYFLCEEHLEPHMSTKEHYLPNSVWT